MVPLTTRKCFQRLSETAVRQVWLSEVRQQIVSDSRSSCAEGSVGTVAEVASRLQYTRGLEGLNSKIHNFVNWLKLKFQKFITKQKNETTSLENVQWLITVVRQTPIIPMAATSKTEQFLWLIWNKFPGPFQNKFPIFSGINSRTFSDTDIHTV